MNKIQILIVGCILASSAAVSDPPLPPVYGTSSDNFDINSISSYLDDDDSSSSSSNTKLGGSSGTYSYTNYNQGSGSVSPTAAAFKSAAPTNYPPLPGSTAATSAGTSYSSNGVSQPSSAFYSQTYTQNSPSSSSSQYASNPSQYSGQDSYAGTSSYGNSYKGDTGSSSGSFNFPSGSDSFEPNDDPKGHPHSLYSTGSYSSAAASGQSPMSYKPQASYRPQSTYKRPSRLNPYSDSAGPTSPIYGSASAHSFGSSSQNFGPFDDRDPMPGSPFFDSRPNFSPYASPQAMASNFEGFDEPDYANPWTNDPYMGFRGRPQYDSGPPPNFKDYMSYKGYHNDLPYSPNSHFSHSYNSKPHVQYSGSHPSGYRGPGPKYPSGKGSRYPRHPRPGYTSPRGYSGHRSPPPHHPRYPSQYHRPSSAKPYPSYPTRHH